MSEHRCHARVHYALGGTWWGCESKAKYFENGKHYCGIHAPSQKKAREQKKKDRAQARHDKLHSDPKFIKSQISLCKARIEAHQTELSEWESKLEAVT